MTLLSDTLTRYFGHEAFRGGQQQVVEALLSGRDALCIMPTGAGKSVCYQVPALNMAGITLVISPLISLMKDQVAALLSAGVRGAYLNSSLTAAQMDKALARAMEGTYKIIYVAPERLETSAFLAFAKNADIALVAVDEAHCVSQWGQDFRPSYLKIAHFVQSLKKRPPIGAFTATATKEVREDIAAMLCLNNPLELVTGFDRANLFFEVRTPDDKFSELLKIEAVHRDLSGIVYCQTRKTVEEVAARLNAFGISATQYHAGLPDLTRHQNQDDFIFDRKKIMVATNAFGMGIDKSNVSYVVHYNMPMDLESYYQEAGRAGRDGEKADCILLYAKGDVHICRYLLEHTLRPEGIDPAVLPLLVEREMERLKQMTIYSTRRACLRDYILRYFGERSRGYCGNCGNCLTHYSDTDMTEAARAIALMIDELAQKRRSFGKTMLISALRGSDSEKVQRFRLNECKAFGALARLSVATLSMLFDEMRNRGYLDTASGEYPVIVLSETGRLLLSEGHRFFAKLPEERKAPVKANDVSDGLFRALKKLRGEIADERNLPAYIIFTDATLRDMAQKRPRTLDAFAMVSGVGRAKAERYGLLFVREIGRYLG